MRRQRHIWLTSIHPRSGRASCADYQGTRIHPCNQLGDVLRVEGRIDFAKYEGMEPVYTEYNVGHYARAFTLSNKIDQEQISAELDDGVLTLTLKKAKEAMPRRIAIS